MSENEISSDIIPSAIKQRILRVTPEEASKVITKQLVKGLKVVKALTRKLEQVDLVLTINKLDSWDKYNSTLLRGIFTTTTFADHYENCASSIGSLEGKSVEELQRKVTGWFVGKRAELVSICERLPLFDMAPGPASTTGEEAIDKKSVVVVYGRNEKLKNSMFDFLTAIGLRPLDWIELKTIAMKETKKGTPYTGEIVAKAFGKRAVVVLLTGDDEARLRKKFRKESDPEYEKEFTPQARPNVLFEAGMAIGRSDEQTILVEIGTVRPWTDIAGRHVTKFDGSHEKKHELIVQLRAIGCDANDSGSRWMDVGDFEEEPDIKESNRSGQESIHTLEKQPVGKETPLGNLNQRVKRILDLKDAKKQTEGDSENCGEFLGNLKGTETTVKLPTSGDNFQLYFLWEEVTDSDIWLVGIWYVAVLAGKLNIEMELAAIRVLMEKCRQLKNDKCTFIVATNEDLSSQRDSIQRAFETKKGFIRQDSRQLFSLEIWDKHGLVQKEKELGILS